MIDVLTRLAETNAAIELFKAHNVRVPDEALEIQEVMQRCVAAESALALAQQTPEDVAINMQLDKEAYEAYARHTGWKSLATGSPLPQWDDLSKEIRTAWQVSAAWVAGRVMRHYGLMK